ncbi:ABC transporter substrate-binding protein [Chitiniphilus shinanonensis]|uniref:ABC transporter substrate-binding protein n=1 Tax=Chitiniphilus shinanonensis TaxID=553088 RepID=A0ABQ6BUL0_9NEIS|nr:ABC transporter substrate-binding protein [Chitiniphilus shinanonensis]GLS05685.1 ABC transporter substrate-binding protein [Chitiniphilus shinanonensis]
MAKWWLLFLLLCLGPGTLWAAPQTVPVYVYHDYPPYIVEDGHDLSHALVDALNARAGGRYRFELKMLPRRRVDRLIAAPDWQGVIAWANPAWVKPSAERLQWSPPLLDDADLWVTLRGRPLNREQIEVEGGYRLGALLGHQYAELERHRPVMPIQRFDTASMESLARMLLAGRVDVITMPANTEGWLAEEWPQWRAQVATQPRGKAIQRFLLSNAGDPALGEFLAGAAQALYRDPAWSRLP